jgi:hypothetical protein
MEHKVGYGGAGSVSGIEEKSAMPKAARATDALVLNKTAFVKQIRICEDHIIKRLKFYADHRRLLFARAQPARARVLSDA